MYSNILNSISSTIFKSFPNTPIYLNKLSQGSDSPHFFIKPQAVDYLPLINSRSKVILPINIIYFFGESTTNKQALDTSNSLISTLKTLNTKYKTIYPFDFNIDFSSSSQVTISFKIKFISDDNNDIPLMQRLFN